MANDRKKSVLIDTSFLITLYAAKIEEADRKNQSVAKKYFRYFLDNSIRMLLSTVVVSEFQQMQPIVDIVNSGNYIILPYNYEDAVATADIAYNVDGVIRGSGRAEFKDDLKLMGQAKAENIDFLITEDSSTLAKYCEKLTKAGMFKTRVITLESGFDNSHFANGQKSLLDSD
jgi:hypothetical protein